MKTPAFRKTALAALTIVSFAPLAACSSYGDDRPRYGYRDRDRGWDRGDYVLNDNDQIYRDRDGNYYCQKPDGTKGAIVGGLAGGVLGNVIAPNGSKTLGTIIGAAGGAIAGQAVEKGSTRCR